MKKKEDFSVSKVLVLEVGRPEFDPQGLHWKESSLVVHTCNPRLGRQRHDYLKLTPSDIDHLASSKSMREPISKKLKVR